MTTLADVTINNGAAAAVTFKARRINQKGVAEWWAEAISDNPSYRPRISASLSDPSPNGSYYVVTIKGDVPFQNDVGGLEHDPFELTFKVNKNANATNRADVVAYATNLLGLTGFKEMVSKLSSWA